MKPKNSSTPNALLTKQVLIVDDDASVREMVGRVLSDEGYTVRGAANGREAEEAVRSKGVDLVLLDLMMPGENGWDVFERLTTLNPMLGVIVITARPNQVFTALGAGVVALLEKPLEFPKLLDIVRAALSEPAEARLARLAGHQADFHYRSSATNPG